MTDFGLDGCNSIECETACSEALRRDEGWEVSRSDSCTAKITPTASPDPEAVAATVQCAGRSIEYFCEGRRPAGHLEVDPTGDGLARHLGQCAHLEAAAVTAFDDLVLALRRWCAPESLVDRCLRARAQEVQHARDVGALAMRHGAVIVAPMRTPRELSRLQLAIDNATEGCVHEAWAALRARWMAEHAHDPSLRTLYARISQDELEHAQLSWDLHAWLLSGLGDAERAGVGSAQRAALNELPHIAGAQALSAPAVLGLPDRATSIALARDFCGRLAAA